MSQGADDMSDAQYKPEYIAAVCKELETRGWQPDSRGEPDCVDEACAAGADIIKALQSRCEAAERDAGRYRWMRSRLWIRKFRPVSGGEARPALATIVGRSFIDSTVVAANERYAMELDAAIDTAIKEAGHE